MRLKEKLMKISKLHIVIAVGCVLLVLIIGLSITCIRKNKKTETVYKETKVQYGMLTVGVTESGTVDIGTVSQNFDLDMSALQRVDTGSSSTSSGSGSGNASGGGSFPGGMSGGMGGSAGGTGGGMNMFSQMQGGSSNLVASGDDSSLTVGNVLVSVGQKVSEGDVLYELAEGSASELEQKLKENVEKATTDLEAVKADQTLSKQTAKSTYDSSVAYGNYAQTEYNLNIQELSDKVEECKQSVEKAQTTLADYQAQLEDITASYNDAAQAYENVKYSRDTTDPLDAYWYAYYYDLTDQASETAESLKQQKETLEKNVEQAQTNLETATTNYNKAVRNLESGKLSSQETLDLRKLAFDTAQETYDVTLQYLDEDAKKQQEIYDEAKEKWEEFSSYISDNKIVAKYDGVITSVELSAGDKISTGSALVTLYDLEDVSMTVSVYEEDMENIALGSEAIIDFTAYPDDIYEAKVSEISDASTDSNGNVIYDVTVTIEGDASGLFQAMTGDITFVTEKSEETLYVSKRAVITEDDKSYVKVRDNNGKIVKKSVTVGFTDGKNIQILSGLSEGDTVLIESKVSGS